MTKAAEKQRNRDIGTFQSEGRLPHRASGAAKGNAKNCREMPGTRC
jgi:hypothetical protein